MQVTKSSIGILYVAALPNNVHPSRSFTLLDHYKSTRDYETKHLRLLAHSEMQLTTGARMQLASYST